MPALERLTIRGSEWRRGGDRVSRIREFGKTRLLYGDTGKRCCLGILARQRGVPDAAMLYIGTPSRCRTDLPGGEVVNAPARKFIRWFEEEMRSQAMPIGGGDIFTKNDHDASYDEMTIREHDKMLFDYIPEEDQDIIDSLRPIFRDMGYTIVWRPDL